jgi:glycosyltransferase involved in cell wall biosynthesis
MLKDYHAMLVVLRKTIFGSFPSKLYGAIAAGLPVIYSGSGDGEEFVSSFELGWISKPADYKNLAVNLVDLASMTNQDYVNLRQRIAALAENTFDLDAQLDDLARFLDDLC